LREKKRERAALAGASIDAAAAAKRTERERARGNEQPFMLRDITPSQLIPKHNRITAHNQIFNMNQNFTFIGHFKNCYLKK
jgi:hypothetical protein